MAAFVPLFGTGWQEAQVVRSLQAFQAARLPHREEPGGVQGP